MRLLVAALACAALLGTAPAATPTDTDPWAGAGAFVLTTNGVDPTELARTLRANGFSWTALAVHDGLTTIALEPGWVARYRAAGGPPLGGWGVLRTEPEREAALASDLVRRHVLAFYVANAEREYEWTNNDVRDDERLGRSRRFVDAFRARQPALLASVSSFCRADRHDIDWLAWRDAGFAFLPQAYANDFGPGFGPAGCAEGSTGAFPLDRIHPTLGTYPSRHRVTAEEYTAMLESSPTRGFSLYLAETDMTPAKWRTYGRAAREVAAAPSRAAWGPGIEFATGAAPTLTLYGPATLPVGARGDVTLHFFSSAAGSLRIAAGGRIVRTVRIRAAQNLLRLRLDLPARPQRLELVAVSTAGRAGKPLVVRVRYGG